MIQEAIPKIKEFSLAEKLLLVEELWDDIAAHPAEVSLQDWHKEELQRRYHDYLANPESGSDWSEVKARLLVNL